MIKIALIAILLSTSHNYTPIPVQSCQTICSKVCGPYMCTTNCQTICP
jgi:hypothetical protein